MTAYLHTHPPTDWPTYQLVYVCLNHVCWSICTFALHTSTYYAVNRNLVRFYHPYSSVYARGLVLPTSTNGGKVRGVYKVRSTFVSSKSQNVFLIPFSRQKRKKKWRMREVCVLMSFPKCFPYSSGTRTENKTVEWKGSGGEECGGGQRGGRESIDLAR